jgi:hypothetical protein
MKKKGHKNLINRNSQVTDSGFKQSKNRFMTLYKKENKLFKITMLMKTIPERSFTSKLLAVTITTLWKHPREHKNLNHAKEFSKNHKKISNF